MKERSAKLPEDDHTIRVAIFSIPTKSRFEIKSMAMAGNIIPAIATTNTNTAGIVVLHAFKVLQGKFEKCQSVYMRLRPNARNQLFIPDKSEYLNLSFLINERKPDFLTEF